MFVCSLQMKIRKKIGLWRVFNTHSGLVPVVTIFIVLFDRARDASSLHFEARALFIKPDKVAPRWCSGSYEFHVHWPVSLIFVATKPTSFMFLFRFCFFVFVFATKDTFVATSILLSRQKMCFVATKIILVAAPANDRSVVFMCRCCAQRASWCFTSFSWPLSPSCWLRPSTPTSVFRAASSVSTASSTPPSSTSSLAGVSGAFVMCHWQRYVCVKRFLCEVDGDDDCFYRALISALEQTHCACMRFYMSD